MSYVAPSTRSTGNLITAAIWNQDIRDNRNFLHNCPAAQVYRTTNQTISSGSHIGVGFDAEVFDSDGLHAPGAPSQITIKDNGVYFFHAMVKWESGVASLRSVRLRHGLGIIAWNQMRIGATAAAEMSISMVWRAASSQNPHQVEVFQDSGGPLDVVSDGTFRPRFGICWIGSGV